MPASNPIPIRIAGYHPEANVHSRAVRRIEQSLRTTAAALCIPQVTLNIVGLGHKTAEIVGLVANDTFDLAYISSIPFRRYVPELAAFVARYVVHSVAADEQAPPAAVAPTGDAE